MSFADRPLAALVAAQVETAGATIVATPASATLRLFVFASRETPDAPAAFARRVSHEVKTGARAIVADIDPKGDVQGASLPFVEALRGTHVLPRLFGYASWNTAGNTLGLAVAQGVIFALAVDRIAPHRADVARRVALAQVHYLFYRLVNDFLYQGVVRAQAIEQFLTPRRMSAVRLDDSQRTRVERYLLDELRPLAESLTGDFANGPWVLPGPSRRAPGIRIQVGDLKDFTLTLPWSRTFEAEIHFVLATAPPR
jgi:hypothetical protein